MPRRTFAASVSFAAIAAIVATAAACIDVPDSMRAQFAPAGPSERTNYRPGNRSTPAPVDVQIPDASARDADLDAGPSLSSPRRRGAPDVAEGGQV